MLTFFSHLCQHFCSNVSDVTHKRLREMFYIHLYAVTRVFSPWVTPRSVNVAGVAGVIWKQASKRGVDRYRHHNPAEPHLAVPRENTRVFTLPRGDITKSTCAVVQSGRHFGRSPVVRPDKQMFKPLWFMAAVGECSDNLKMGEYT